VKITGYALEEAFADYRRGHRPALTKYTQGETEKERERERDKTHRLARIQKSRDGWLLRSRDSNGSVHSVYYARQSTTIICHLKKARKRAFSRPAVPRRSRGRNYKPSRKYAPFARGRCSRYLSLRIFGFAPLCGIVKRGGESVSCLGRSEQVRSRSRYHLSPAREAFFFATEWIRSEEAHTCTAYQSDERGVTRKSRKSPPPRRAATEEDLGATRRIEEGIARERLTTLTVRDYRK
jgi:hypothetical protein